MVMVLVPALAREVTVSLRVDEAPAATDEGVKLALTPFGRPDADKEIVKIEPLTTLVEICEVPLLPRATDTEVGFALMLKSETGAAVTVRVTVVVCVLPPLLPVMVTVCGPVAAVADTVKVRVEVPAPAMDVGLKPAVTPFGRPDADKAIDDLKPFKAVVVIVEEPLLPCITETKPGDAPMVKSGGRPVTVSLTVVVCVMPLPVLVTVMV